MCRTGKRAMKKSLAGLSATAMALSMALTMFAAPASAEESQNQDVALDIENIEIDGTRATTYSEYYDMYADKVKPLTTVKIDATSYISNEGAELETHATYQGKNNVIVWKNNKGTVTFEFEIQEAGNYNMAIVYLPITGTNITNDFGIQIDGETPFDGASRISLGRVWENEYPIKQDSKGNDVRPPQVEKEMWIDTPLNDEDGLFNDPYYFYLTEGKHTLTIDMKQGNIAFSELRFYNEEDPESYAEVSADYDLDKETSDEYKNYLERIEGEDAVYKSDTTLYPTYDRASYKMSPAHPTKMRYNSIGQNNWTQSGQWIEWEFEVPEDGYYKIGMKVRQNVLRGLYSNRRLTIDGEIPFAEAGQVQFKYSNKWYYQVLGGDEPQLVYLTKGKHTLRMEAIPGEIGETMRSLDEVVYQLNDYYRRILMITGPKPDSFNDYYIDQQIPSLLDDFQKIVDTLYQEKENVERIAGSQGGSDAVALEKTAILLRNCINKPDIIPSQLANLKSTITSLSTWMLDGRKQPLEVDYIEIASVDQEFPSVKEGFFQKMSFGFQAFLGSFFEDYSSLSDSSQEALNVWVSLGRDQAQVVKDLTDSIFTPDTGIPVNINLVQGSILEATMAGKGPDVGLFIGGDLPVNLAARETLVNLKQFPDYEEVRKRFAEEADVYYSYDGGTYALPVSQNFPMLFYRTDVLSELGIDKVPSTWDEFIDIIPTIQRKYLTAGLILPGMVPNQPANITAITESGHTFATLLLQRGMNYFNEDLTATIFDTKEAVDCFEMWTKFYTNYSFEQQYDAFSRFRTGEIPILISSYTFYTNLLVNAPEIKGMWSFAPVPGTVQEDGTVSHATNSAGTGAVIFNKVQQKENGLENAWEFIKWFTSTEIQQEYGRTIEGLMGPLGRFDAANMEALERLSWSESDLELLKAQRAQLKEIPVIPASYSVTRNVNNAFRTVVNNNENPRETLIWYNRDINEEITRKYEEIGIALGK